MIANVRVRRLELAISYLLRAGVAASLVLVVAGFVLSLVQHPGWAAGGLTYRQVLGTGHSPFTTWPEVLSGVARRDGQSLVMLGLLVLISTPVMRVAISIGLFAFQRDRNFVWITCLVLVLLLVSFALGKAGV